MDSYLASQSSRFALAWLATALFVGSSSPASAQPLPRMVFSIAASNQTICDSNCTTCTVASGECILVSDEDLFMCIPLSTTLPITQCDWEPFFDGDAPAIGLTAQMFAADIVPNGSIVFRSGGDRTLPDLSQIKSRDVGLFIPDDVLKPYTDGGAYTSGTFKLYLDGDATQASSSAAPWNAIEVMTDGSCELTITAAGTHTCATLGSLAGGHILGGIDFRDEDVLRCIPTANSSGGSITACAYSMFLEASHVNSGTGNGFTGDLEAAELLSFDPATFSGRLVFRGPSDPDLPVGSAPRDLVLYDGTFGNGICTGAGAELCASTTDCPVGETCNTGTCSVSATACASDGDCAGGGNVCNRTRVPTGTYSLFFDGTLAGLAGQTLHAFAVVPDLDGDGVIDGVDNCPNDANPPEICTDGTTVCTTSADCAPGDTCAQKDSDGDGVGDVCDQCNGRDDAVCFCGDAIRDVPSERCDLGAENGQPDSPCSATCQIVGHCTGSGDVCEDASDCPPGEGCCGNAVVEGDEGCDDGNSIAGDACNNSCELNPGGIPVLGCEDVFGPHLTPAFVKSAKFLDTTQVAGPGFDRWKSKGDFNLATGTAIDPDTETVRLLFNQGLSPALYDVSLPPGSFLQKGSLTSPKWLFFDKEADVPGALGFRKARFGLKNNKVKNTVDGRNVALAIDTTAPIRVRQTIRIGDECVTGVLDCTPKGTSLKCSTVVFGSPGGAFVETRAPGLLE
jgi:cysteine-rich repeat protein